MKKFTRPFAFAIAVSALLMMQNCNEEDPTVVPTVKLSAATGTANPGEEVKVTATVSGATSLSFTATGGLTIPTNPAPVPDGAETMELTFTIPATATIGNSFVVVVTASNDKGINSAPETFTITAGTTILTGVMTANTTLRKGKSYLISSTFIVPSGLTLTIEPGTVVKGDKATKGVLIVKQGGTIMANGTATDPIVFTSSQPVLERDKGDWGGIVIMGDAFVNQTAKPAVEGLTAPTNDPTFYNYGTPSISDASAGNNTQNSGTLRYVRIEYAGNELIANSETNSLTLAAVGSGTTIEYVQASFGGDDGFEWFGGTVNAKYLVSFATWDDDFDTDFGWRGNVQWGLAVRAPFIADQSGSTSFESDSQGNANAIGSICTSTPGQTSGCTQGVFSNITVLGPRDYNRSISGSYSRGLHIRRRTAISIYNSVITGYPTSLTMDDQGTLDNYTNGAGVFKNNVLFSPILPNSATNSTFASGNAYYASNVGGATGTIANFWESNSANIIVKGLVATKANGDFASNWAATAVSADNIINPYTGTGLETAPFYGGTARPIEYTATPNFAVTSGTLQGLNSTDLFPSGSKVDNAFFNKTLTYKGAFGANDWTDTWTEWVPVSKSY
jgi:hypothetical protein